MVELVASEYANPGLAIASLILNEVKPHYYLQRL